MSMQDENRFHGLWNEFGQVQSNIEELVTEEAAVALESDERSNFEDKYYAVATAYENLIQQKELVASQALAQENQVREGTPMSQTTSLANDSLKLSQVSMPTFSGKFDEWISFRNMFHSMIEQNATLPDVQKMQYLLSSLKGEAFDVISFLEASAENYKEAWQMLKSRYDDPGLIIENHVKALFDLPTMSKDNHSTLRKLLDTILKHIRALTALRRPTDYWDDLLIHMVTSKLDQSTYREWETTIERGKIPDFEQLINFLNQQCRALEATSRLSKTSGPLSKDKTARSKSTTAHVAITKNACGFCRKENHATYKCKDFLDFNIQQQIKEAKSHKLCLNCLRTALHIAKECTSGTCRKCSKRHNTLLHLEQATKNQSDSNSKEEIDDSENTKTVTANNAAVNHNGSQSCFITKDCCKELGLDSRDTNIPVCGIGKQSIQTRSIATIVIHSRTTSYRRELDCLVMNNITQDIPTNGISKNELQVPKGIVLADPQFNQPSRIDLLLGAEVFFDLLCIGRMKLADNQPTWQKTRLGWIVSDGLATMQNPKVITCSLSVNEQLNSNLTKFWQQESCNRMNTRTSEERACENHFGETYKRDSDGRFIITLSKRTFSTIWVTQETSRHNDCTAWKED
ncbi:PREDICTED: uncharacterized protein LOC108759963 [Trachymyrmex cornetzi]|uniref:uncharacterized protein LOC108759963 n=1 Tax=Trachymyrmex cornetzi TaxID=471704 RepID=UPI00084F1239|nr:PREDICTED: uncharacterized protein LOC108759963 [Trachymyrmex cornetzi]